MAIFEPPWFDRRCASCTEVLTLIVILRLRRMGSETFSEARLRQPRLLSIEYEGAKNVVPVTGVEKSNILSCRPAEMPLNIFANIFSMTQRFLV